MNFFSKYFIPIYWYIYITQKIIFMDGLNKKGHAKQYKLFYNNQINNIK